MSNLVLIDYSINTTIELGVTHFQKQKLDGVRTQLQWRGASVKTNTNQHATSRFSPVTYLSRFFFLFGCCHYEVKNKC